MKKLKRTGYEIGKKIERMPTLNNVNVLFEKGSQTIDLTIVDCVDSKDAAGLYTLTMDMLSRDWKDKTKTLQDLGGNVIWDNLKIRAPIYPEQLLGINADGAQVPIQEMLIEVYDENSKRDDVLIGQTTLSLLRAAYALGEEVDVAVHIKDKNSAPAGMLKLRMELRETEPEVESELPEDFNFSENSTTGSGSPNVTGER